MFKFFHNLLKKIKKSSIDINNVSVHMNTNSGERSYDTSANVVQDKQDKCEGKEELNYSNESFYTVETGAECQSRIDVNRYIKVQKENEIYGEGTYLVGQNGLLPGLYYAWNHYRIIIGQNESFFSGVRGCDDGYVQLLVGNEVVIESGKVTPVDNIIYTYNKTDYLVPGHTYLVGKEVPNGKYRFAFDDAYAKDDYTMEKQCTFHRVAEEDFRMSYEVKAHEGLAETDSKTSYVAVKDGKAMLVEEGIFHPSGGPEEFYNFRMRMEAEKRFKKFRNEMEEKNQQEEFGEFVSYYCAINEPIAEIVILEHFAAFAKVEKIKNLFLDDFSVNYRIDIPMYMIDAQCLLCFMFLSKHITSPATFGVVLADIFRTFNQLEYRTEREKVFEISFANYKKRNPDASAEELAKFRSKMEKYWKSDGSIHSVKEMLKSRISFDACEVMEEYCKIYPFQTIENESYYVSHVSAKHIEPYIGEKCPKYLCYYLYENRNKYEQEYRDVLLNLKEQGIIKSRWKNEFSLYMLIKSYFSSAIYQYHAEWLDKQSLDIYIPEHKIGIEYQGKQHYEEVGLFNGVDGLMETQKRDKIKKEKCKLNGVTLIEWAYTDEVEEQKLIDVLRQLNISIPQKQDITTFYKEDKMNTNVRNKQTSERELQLICQFDLDGNYLNSYENVNIAATETGVSKESIRRVCSGIRNTGGGYMWKRYLKEEIPQSIRPYSSEEKISGPRKIIQYSVSGEFIASYSSVSEAVRKTGINAKSIRETARGKQNHAGGFVWKYEESN